MWSKDMLSDENLKSFDFVTERISDLQNVRKEEHYGTKLESVWLDADKDYAPHRLRGARGRRQLVEDETKGWRGTSAIVDLGNSNWQSDIAGSNPFIKIQTALAILVDQNPSGVFSATAKKYENVTHLIKQLYQRSWEYAKSVQQLKLFVFNLSKYGWAVGRTYPLKITRNVKNLLEYNQEDPDKSVYEDKEIVEFNDIFRENLDIWNVWIDDMARPNNPFSVRDWAWRKVYSRDAFDEEFGAWKNAKYVKDGGITTDKIDQSDKVSKKYKDKHLIEVYFYENRLKDLFMVIANGVPVIISPLPISDGNGNKKLSLWQAYWNLRHAESPYGIGVYEAIRFDNNLLDRIRNMTIDQLTMSIYKMFFYQGTNQITETGDIKIAPGVGKQTLDPKNIQWLEVAGPGAEAWKGLEVFQNDINNSSGITEPLLGNIGAGKQTAFELAQAKESALKRLKTPLDNITDALDQEGYITVSLIQLLYSIPEVYDIVDPELANAYLAEIKSDPELYGRKEDGTLQAKVFREFPLNMETDDQGNLVETEKTRFFRIKPKYLKWEGIVNIKSQSVLTPSKQVDKALDLEMYNMLIPLMAQPPQIYGKIVKSIVKLYDKDPKDVLPDGYGEPPKDQSLFVPGQPGQPPQPQSPEMPQAETMNPGTQMPRNPQSIVGQVASKITQPFRGT